ncbi:uncharacterized protein LOC144649315 isoform X2 [Oculina patagonica]
MQLHISWILLVSSVSLSTAELPSDNDNEEEDSSPRIRPDFWLYGDIKLSDHQKVLLDIPSGVDDFILPRKPPAATREKTLLWEGGVIPYVFDCSLQNMPELQSIVRLAMDDWQSKTCLKFVERKDQKDYVTFFRGSHCYSTVGKAAHQRIEVSVGFGCEYHHVMVHEIGHVIGFWHEQSRPDRDQHVRIIWKNINKGWEHAFLKKTWQDIDSLDTPYDYSSIMHYKLNAFSRSSRRKTIVPLRKVRARPYRRISKLDVLQVKRMYNCDGKNEQSTNSSHIEAKRRIRRDVRKSETGRLVTIRGSSSRSNEVEDPKTNKDPNCKDTSKACPFWAEKGFCETRRDFMLTDCKLSCNACNTEVESKEESEEECVDTKEGCPLWAKSGYCESRPDFMHVKCKKSCHICTEERCMDRDPRCRAWARWKYCTHEKYKNIMMQACRRSCAFCVAETHDCKDRVKSRCPRLKEEGYCETTNPDQRLSMRNMCALTCNFCRKIETEVVTKPTRRPPCVDTFKACFGWSRLGYCSANNRERFMSEYCKKSCNLCVTTDLEYLTEKCLDNDILCEDLKARGYCEREDKKKYMAYNCKMTCNLCRRRIAMPTMCTDKHRFCKYWAARGDCHIKALYMIKNCRRTCNLCDSHGLYEKSAPRAKRPCVDKHEKCPKWSDDGYCDIYSNYMYKKCPLSCEACYPEEENKQVAPCRNKLDDANCEHWAGLGMCQNRAYLMIDKCQHACNSCPKEPVKTRPAEPKGIKCDQACKKWLERGQCSTKWRRRCIRTCLALGCDDEPVRPAGTCSEPLGVGWNFTLPDSAFTASSSFYSGPWDFGAYNGRLYKQDDRIKKRIGGWCARDKSNGQWLQVDLGKIKFVTAVATQGRDKYYEHVKSYELAFSKDGERWNRYKENGRIRVLPGNCDNFTPVVNRLIRPIQARFVRFYPRTSNNVCMRVEVYGCSRHKGYEKKKAPPPVFGLF